MERAKIWVAVLYNTNRKWKIYDYVKLFDSKAEAEQWAQFVKTYCQFQLFGGESIYIGKIPTNVDFLENEVKDGKKN